MESDNMYINKEREVLKMKTYEVMKLSNKYYNIELNKNDLEYVFDRKPDDKLAETLKYFGWNVNHVADLFSAKSETRYTTKEIKEEKESEKYCLLDINW